jgi:hypothetical protein
MAKGERSAYFDPVKAGIREPFAEDERETKEEKLPVLEIKTIKIQ